MNISHHIKRFTREEDGTLLVFFCVSVMVILGIVALSFDMGRRASTQTDMQSFADNVALAAAGELDGSANAITNATAAATSVVIAANENLKAGTGAANLTVTFNTATDLVFYTELPETDRPATYDPAQLGDDANANYKYDLPTTNTTDEPELARFVGVTLTTTDVDWLFAGAVTNNAPDAAVGALAIAGNAGYTCEIAPLMFCMPQTGGTPSAPVDLQEGWAIQLRTAGGNQAFWGSGDFGFLDISDVPGGNCTGSTYNNEARKQACLLARGISACYSNNGVDIQPGQRNGNETAAFNLPFGLFNSTMNQFANDSVYAPGPHAVSGQNYSGGNCNPSASPDTMDFPPDDCHTAGVGGTSTCTYDRIGDGDWSAGRTEYANTNYTVGGDPTAVPPVPPDVPGSFFDFPETGLTRYEYYLREIERAATGGLMDPNGDAIASGQYTNLPAHSQTDNDGGRGGTPDPITAYDSWDDYWPDTPSGPGGINPIIPDAHARVDNGLPQCGGPTPTANADRRVVVAAGIDCNANPLGGNLEDVPVYEYYRVFQLGPAREISSDPGEGPIIDIWVEVIEAIGGEGGGSTASDSAFREVVQLYR